MSTMFYKRSGLTILKTGPSFKFVGTSYNLSSTWHNTASETFTEGTFPSNVANAYTKVSSSMDGETAANFSSCPSDIMVAKVYGESETPSTSGTREHNSRYHRQTGNRGQTCLPVGLKVIGNDSGFWPGSYHRIIQPPNRPNLH